MMAGLRTWRSARAEAGNARTALGWMLQFAALRLWSLVMNCFPIETNLRTARWMGRLWWRVMARHRARALDNLRHAFSGEPDEALRRIARGSFEHFAQLYLAEMVMTPRLVTRWTFARHVELGDLRAALRELLLGNGAIMLTAHFGNFELLGYCLARLGIPLTAVMRPLDNPLINAYLVRTRAGSGLSLLYKRGAMQAAGGILESRGALCFISDQDAGKKGVFADFFGRPASWYRSIGLLAMYHGVPIIVGSATRMRPGFHYRIDVERIIRPREWQGQADPLHWITQQFARAQEAFIRRRPEQYLWMHRRWKHQPPGGAEAGSAPASSASTANT